MAGTFDVSIVLRLVDQLTGPARRASAAAAAMGRSFAGAGAAANRLSNRLYAIHHQSQRLRMGFLGLNHAIAGSVALLADASFMRGLGHIVARGNELVKVQRDMAQAGFENVQIQEAYQKAWQLSQRFQNVGVVDIMKMMNDARMIFGSAEHAIHDIDPFIRSEAFLKAFEGMEKGGQHAADLRREVFAAMKSGEIAGQITPGDMQRHVAQLTAMKVAFGEQVRIADYLTAQRTAGAAMRTVADAFRYGIFPPLVQENGSAAGVMFMTAFNKIVAGVGNRTQSLKQMANFGLTGKRDIAYDKAGRAIGTKTGARITGADLFAQNPLRWVEEVLKPVMDRATAAITDPIRKARQESYLLGQMFPDRNAQKFLLELLQQRTKLHKDAAGLQKTLSSMDDLVYTQGSLDEAIQAVHEQWTNLLEVIGAPVVPTVVTWMNTLATALNRIATFFKEHQRAAKAFMYGLAGSAIAAIGALLIGGFIASVLRAYGVIAMLAGAFRGLRFFLSPGRLLGGIASIGRGLAAFGGVLLAGGLIGRLAALRIAFVGLTRGIAGLALGPLGIIATLLLSFVPDEWWTIAGQRLTQGFDIIKGIVMTAVTEIKGWINSIFDAFSNAASRIKTFAMETFGSLQIPAAPIMLNPDLQPGKTIPSIGSLAVPPAPADNRQITNTITVPVTINATVTNTTPQGIAGAMAGAGQSIGNEVKKALSDGGQ